MGTQLLFIGLSLCLFTACVCDDSSRVLHSTTLGFPHVGSNKDFSTFTAFVNITFAIPVDACSPIQSVHGHAVVVSAGDCFVETKMRNAQEAGAVLVIITDPNDSGSVAFMSNFDSSTILIRGECGAMVSLRVSQVCRRVWILLIIHSV
jgi:hypothetical protein